MVTTMTIRELPEDLRNKSQNELNEMPQRIPSDIESIRQWLQKQSHLHAVKPIDQWLLSFLRGCKFSLERTKEKLDMYYTMRTLVPELFANRDPLNPAIQNILKLGTFLPLKGTASSDSTRVCIVRLGAHDPSKYHLTDLLKVSFMITEILMLEDDNFVISGEEVILDLQGVSLSVIGQFTPALARRVTTCMEKALPVRQRANHIMNTPAGFEAVYAMFRTFLSDKHKKRIQVHNRNYSTMHDQIPKSILPVQYKGTDGKLEELIDHWKHKVESYRQWFLDQEQQRSEESLRSGRPLTQVDTFGLEGSFRKLDLD